MGAEIAGFELVSPEVAPVEVAPVEVARPAQLGGIDWAGVAAEALGQVALVDVEVGTGELQEWEPRGAGQ